MFVFESFHLMSVYIILNMGQQYPFLLVRAFFILKETEIKTKCNIYYTKLHEIGPMFKSILGVCVGFDSLFFHLKLNKQRQENLILIRFLVHG